MSTDLKTQLHTYYSEMVDEQEAITPTKVAERVEAVRPLPTPEPTSPWRWTPVVVIAATAAVILLVLGIPFLVSRVDQDTPPATDPPVTTTTLTTETTGANEAIETSTTIAAVEASGFGSGPYAEWTWSEADIGGIGRIDHIDGIYVRFDPGLWRAQLAEQNGDDSFDSASYYWWSADGEDWTQVGLPDVLGEPTWWRYDEMHAVVWATAGDQSASFVPAVDGEGLVLTAVQSPSALDPTYVLPDMAANGLIPTAGTPGGVNELPGVIGSGNLRLGEGSIWFDLPQDIKDQLPQATSGEGCCGSETALTGGTFAATDDAGIVWREHWSVDGQRISVEVELFDDDEPRVIHTGWVDLPDSLFPIMTTGASPSNGYSVDVLWLSEDGGTTYIATQPDLIADYDPFQPGRVLVGHQDRMLWYFERADLGSPSAEIWETKDGRNWFLVAEDAGFMEVFSIVKGEERLITMSQFGLFVSEDGVTWRGVERPPATESATKAGSGFGIRARNSIWLSSDGLEWFEISLPDSLSPSSENWWAEFVGDWVVIEDHTNETIWIGRVP